MSLENQPEEANPEVAAQIENPTPEPAAPKRRRGRPPKNPDLIQEGIPGTNSKPQKTRAKKSAPDTVTLGRQLVGIHQMAAMLTGIPECQIQDAEGQMLAAGIIAVADQYDLAIDGKTGAALQLFAAAAMVYAPRVLMFNTRMKKQRESKATTAQFHELPQDPTPAAS